jgi:hypothetical protein
VVLARRDRAHFCLSIDRSAQSKKQRFRRVEIDCGVLIEISRPAQPFLHPLTIQIKERTAVCYKVRVGEPESLAPLMQWLACIVDQFRNRTAAQTAAGGIDAPHAKSDYAKHRGGEARRPSPGCYNADGRCPVEASGPQTWFVAGGLIPG